MLMTPPPPAGDSVPQVRFGRRASDRLPVVVEPPPGLTSGGLKKTLIGLAFAALALALAIVLLVAQK
jgi:hypothetical protein